MTLQEALWQDPERMSGAICFRNTRVPVTMLIAYLEKGDLGGFFSGFPGVTPGQVDAVFRHLKRHFDYGRDLATLV